jgi:hypothetical protein
MCPYKTQNVKQIRKKARRKKKTLERIILKCSTLKKAQ